MDDTESSALEHRERSGHFDEAYVEFVGKGRIKVDDVELGLGPLEKELHGLELTFDAVRRDRDVLEYRFDLQGVLL